MASSEKDSRAVVWSGFFDSWEKVPSAGDGFVGERWISKLYEQLERYLSDLSILGDDALPPRPSSLPMFCALTRPQSVLDVGGSSGWVWFYLKAVLERPSVEQYDILELDSVKHSFSSSRYHETEPIRYISKKQIICSYDVLYLNSVLQYIYDDTAFLQLVAAANPKYILIDDLFVGDFDDYFSCQIYYESRIAIKIRNRQSFFQSIGSLYKVTYNDNYLTEIKGIRQEMPTEGIPVEKIVRNGKTVILERLD